MTSFRSAASATTVLALIAFLSFLQGCSESAPAWSGTVRDSAGVEIVTSPAEGVWAEGEGWSVEPELSIGGSGATDDAELFGLLSAVGVDAAGRMYVLDGTAREVRVFGPEGEHLATYGGPGSGPGELGLAAVAVLVTDDGTAYVPDMQNGRINIYAPEEPARSIPFTVLAGGGRSISAPIRFALAPDGRVLIQLRSLPGPTAGAEDQAPAESDPIVAYDPAGGRAPDTVTVLPAGATFTGSGAGPGMPAMRIFAAEPVWAIFDDGTIAQAINDRYRITYRALDGTVSRIVEREVARRAVTEADQEQIRTAFRKLITDQGQPPQAADMFLQNVSFAESYPAFAQFLAGPDGTLWVQRIRAAEELSIQGMEDLQQIGSPTWDVFDAEGRFLGSVRLPDRFTPSTWKGDSLYGIMSDELDVQAVVRLRLVR